MVSIYEPGETAASLKALFSELRAGLLPILEAAQVAARTPLDFLFRDFPEEGQRAFGLSLAEKLGYDLQARAPGYHGASVRGVVYAQRRAHHHPLQPQLPSGLDVWHRPRGWACALRAGRRSRLYPHNAATDLVGLYAVGGTSFGAHESQSRLWENHVVRSLTFWQRHFLTCSALPGSARRCERRGILSRRDPRRAGLHPGRGR